MTSKEAIERLKWVEKRISDITYSPESFEALEFAIKVLEERPQGEWIRGEDDICYWYECSKCGHRPLKDSSSNFILSNYCPDCGAAMQKGE